MCPKLLRVKWFVPALDRRWSCRRRKAVDLLHSETCHLFTGGIIVVDSKAYKLAAHSFDTSLMSCRDSAQGLAAVHAAPPKESAGEASG